ncbi:hypothetical protein [Streptomyces sp. NPDC059168]|uniref:hypothetical protein n=1 Tax=Streptomyces sp. NPDC059168 TaxID=3346753 RepID=UPI0036AB81F3
MFTRDITRLPGPAKGFWFHACAIIGIVSRYIVQTSSSTPSYSPKTAERAEEPIRETVSRNGSIVPHTVHMVVFPAPHGSSNRLPPTLSNRCSGAPG